MFAPGHLGELTQMVDFALVDAVLEETGAIERRLRLLPSRVVVYFVLALALFEDCSYRGVWGKLMAGLDGLPLVRPALASLSRARRRIGVDPLRRLFEVLAEPVAHRGQASAFWRGLRTVAVDATLLHRPDDPAITWRYPKRAGDTLEFGYPCCGWWSLSSAAPGPSWPPRSDPRATAKPPTRTARCGRWTARCSCWRTPASHAAEFTRNVHAAGAQFLVRSSARRIPTPARHLADGSYLTRIGYGVLPAPQTVRVIEASVTLTMADGTVRREQWRLLTSLLEPRPSRPLSQRVPAARPLPRHRADLPLPRAMAGRNDVLFDQVHDARWPGPALAQLPCLDQEVYTLLVAYQALIRTAADTACTRPGLDMDRISFTVLLHAAADTVITATGILPPPGPVDLAGTIGRAALQALHPARHRRRVKARTRKNPTNKYSPNAGQHPKTGQNYTGHTAVTCFQHGLTNRSRRQRQRCWSGHFQAIMSTDVERAATCRRGAPRRCQRRTSC